MVASSNIGHGLHTPRLKARQAALDRIFSVEQMKKCWKKYVRPGLRDQEVLDLFDNNDFHWGKVERFADLRRLILSGKYRPRNSIPTKIEKKHGVCRTVVTPSAEDCLVLQCIVESLISTLLKGQPSKNAFFSRSHQAPDASFRFAKDYIWFTQWRKFAKVRLEVASVHNWVATTDIATYFDNVQYEPLRNIISTFDGIDEVVLDILFSILETLTWRPDYLPRVKVGLPQVQFDAPRLLAHVYLFEIDSYLKESTHDRFVRWVDDITLAGESEEQCKLILRDLDSLLQMRGVRLNSGKTHVMPASTARRFFHQRENDNLTRWKNEFEAEKSTGSDGSQTLKKVRKSFELFTKRESFGQSDKIIKRFVGFAADAKSDFALEYVLSKFASDPALRGYAYWYLSALPPSENSLEALEKYLKSDAALDDASQCQIARLLTAWEVAPGTVIFGRLEKLADEMGKEHFIGADSFRFVGALWMLAKYANQKRIVQFIEDSRAIWQHSEFLSRQVAAASGKFRDQTAIDSYSKILRQHSLPASISVLDALDWLRSFENSIPQSVRMYILNGKNASSYSIQRFLITACVLGSPKLAKQYRKTLHDELQVYLRDPHYKAVATSLIS